MKCLVLIVLGMVVVSGIPLKDKFNYMALENPDLFEGDIVGYDPDDRNAVTGEHRRWPNRTIPYVIHRSLEDESDVILKAMEDYHKHTCIRFKKREDEKHYIKLVLGEGCFSKIGRSRHGKQIVSLGYGCHGVGTIVHELGHAVGLFHEQNRSDRDDHLIIHWESIKKGAEGQFRLLKPKQNILYVPFDYNSIMIYGNYAFSEGWKKTMEARDGTELTNPDRKAGLAPSDILRINKMYDC